MSFYFAHFLINAVQCWLNTCFYRGLPFASKSYLVQKLRLINPCEACLYFVTILYNDHFAGLLLSNI